MVLHPCTDTRTLFHPSASVFFAIRGPWHNGHDFLGEAHAKGVRRFVVSESPNPGDPWREDSDVIVVPDTTVFTRTSSYLLARGITRLVLEGSLIALDS